MGFLYDIRYALSDNDICNGYLLGGLLGSYVWV